MQPCDDVFGPGKFVGPDFVGRRGLPAKQQEQGAVLGELGGKEGPAADELGAADAQVVGIGHLGKAEQLATIDGLGPAAQGPAARPLPSASLPRASRS